MLLRSPSWIRQSLQPLWHPEENYGPVFIQDGSSVCYIVSSFSFFFFFLYIFQVDIFNSGRINDDGNA